MKRLSGIIGAIALAATLAAASVPAAAGPAPKREQRIAIAVTSKGFEPASVRVKAGHPVRLVVTRKTDRTCATDIVIKDLGIRKPLPLNEPVEVRFTPRKAGALRYACAMDMIAGSLIVE